MRVRPFLLIILVILLANQSYALTYTVNTFEDTQNMCMFVDDTGPNTYDVIVDPSYNNGIFSLTATTEDTYSTIKTAEYFLGRSIQLPHCGVPGTGTPIYPEDDSFDLDHLVEYLKAEDVIFFNDGANWVCIQSQDNADNWGNCNCANFETDTLPPEEPFNVRLNDEYNPDEYLVCGINPTLTATICDIQSDIQGGEFFFDLAINQIPDYWSGYWMEPGEQFQGVPNGVDFYHCSNISAPVNMENLSDGTHYIKLRGKDILENWGKISQQSAISFIKDTTAPSTDKTLSPFEGTLFDCYGYEESESDVYNKSSEGLTDGCYYVKDRTTIFLIATDPDPQGTGEFAGNVIIHYKFWWKQNPEDPWQLDHEGQSHPDESMILTLIKDSYNLIEYWSEDLCGWEEEHHFELDIVVECMFDDDCDYLDKDDYCYGDLIKHDEGKCVDYECTTDTTTVTDCNNLDNDYCYGTEIKHDDYTCNNTNCVLNETTLVKDCDNQLYCNGQETCADAACVAGTPIDCSANDITVVAECFYSPDDIDYTWDDRTSFTSVCEEEVAGYYCTIGNETITHTCDYDTCGAECDATHGCTPNSCNETYSDYCDGKKLTEYDDDKIKDSTTVVGTCLNYCESECTCTDCTPDCSAPQTNTYCVKDVCGAECDITNACADTECDGEDGCVGLDYYDYDDIVNACLGDCSCEANACTAYTIYESDMRCVEESTVTRSFSDNTPDQCSELTVSLTVDVNDVDTHYAIDEQVPSGWIISDPGTGDTSELGHIKWIILMGPVDTIYTYNITVPCYALGTYIFDGIYMFESDTEEQTILGETDVDVQPIGCQNDDDCNDLDKDYCYGDLIKHDEGRCVDYECTTETITVEDCNELDNDYCDNTLIKNDDYTCEAASCVLDSTTTVKNCYDGLWCNGLETCKEIENNAQCVNGTPVDCSQFNLSQIETCDNDPDNNPLTWDYREGFTSECAEDTKGWHCTTDVGTVTSECSVGNCGADCDSSNPCADTDCDKLDGCVGNDYYDYDDVLNDCLCDCTCTNNQCEVPIEISYNDTKCVECNASEELRACINETHAKIEYKWNYDTCGEPYNETEEDPSCNCDYTKWEYDECVSDGYLRQTRTETTEFDYCENEQYQEIEDAVCNCDYSEWTDNECIEDGFMRQTRIETSNHNYCNESLTREIQNETCDCISTEISRECVENVTALVNYSWNYPYCGPDSEYVYDESCLICIPNWICTEYSECMSDNYQYCLDVSDINNCGQCYTGDYSEFIKECNYCSIHGPRIITNDEITVYEGDLVTLSIEMTDPDEDPLTYSISSPVGNDKKWQTQKGDKGEYDILITVSDGICTTTKTVKIIVKEKSRQSLIIKRTNYKEFIKPGKTQELFVTLENTGNENFEDLKITAFIDTLGIWKKTRQFDLKKGQETTKLIEFYIPYYASKGRHYIRIVVSNDNIRRVIYRDFDVI